MVQDVEEKFNCLRMEYQRYRQITDGIAVSNGPDEHEKSRKTVSSP